MRMTVKQRRKMQNDFLDRCGPNTRAFIGLMNTLPDACFYMKDTECRIMVLNKRNCEVCNIKDDIDVIGLRSDEVFSPQDGTAYMELDREVMRTRKPALNRIETRPADKSHHFVIGSVFPVKDDAENIIGTMRLYRMSTFKGSVHEWQGKLREVAAYIQSHCTDDLPPEMLAAMAGSSVSQFKRNFMKVSLGNPLGGSRKPAGWQRKTAERPEGNPHPLPGKFALHSIHIHPAPMPLPTADCWGAEAWNNRRSVTSCDI